MSEIPVTPQIWKLAAAILTPQQQTALELRERHGFSWNQIAIAMNKTRPTVKEHHRAATKNLHDTIEAADGDIDLALTCALDEETPEEKQELDRLWRESKPRPTSERKTA